MIVHRWEKMRVLILHAGEARTEAMVKASARAFCEGEAAQFDSFADPAGLIMQHIIEQHCKEAPNRKALLARAKALKLPNNPLVSALASSRSMHELICPCLCEHISA